MKDKCPVCKKFNCINEVVYDNTEAYGSHNHRVSCKYCKAPINVSMSVEVNLDSIILGDHKTDDWGNNCVSPAKTKK